MRVFAIVLMFTPLFMFENGLLVGLLVFAIGLFCFDATIGVSVDAEKRSYQMFTNSLGFHFGKWVRVDEHNSLVISYVNLKSKSNTKGFKEAPISLRDLEFHITLVDNLSKSSKVLYRCYDENEAERIGTEIGELLQIKIFDGTSQRMHWADPTQADGEVTG